MFPSLRLVLLFRNALGALGGTGATAPAGGGPQGGSRLQWGSSAGGVTPAVGVLRGGLAAEANGEQLDSLL